MHAGRRTASAEDEHKGPTGAVMAFVRPANDGPLLGTPRAVIGDKKHSENEQSAKSTDNVALWPILTIMVACKPLNKCSGF